MSRYSPDTEVPVIDVTDEPKVNVDNNRVAADIARSLIGKTFRIIGSNANGKIASMGDGKHLVHSSNQSLRHNHTREKALSVAEKILNNCVYIEKHPDVRHGKNNRYIELFSVVKDGNRLVRFLVVAKEGDSASGEFKIGIARFYDIIKDGALQESGVLRHYKHEGASSTLTIAELLKGVKDREGRPYVNKDGSLNYDARIFRDGEELSYPAPDDSTKYSADSNDDGRESEPAGSPNRIRKALARLSGMQTEKNVEVRQEGKLNELFCNLLRHFT